MSDEVKKIKFSDIKKSAVGLLPMTNNSFWEYTPKQYECLPEEFRPIFKIKQYNISQVDRIKELLSNKKKASDEKVNSAFLDCLHEVFAGWENLYDLNTEELIKYDGSRAMMTIIPHHILLDIFSESLIVGGIVPNYKKLLD